MMADKDVDVSELYDSLLLRHLSSLFISMEKFLDYRVIHCGMVDETKQISTVIYTMYHGIPMARFSGLPCNSLWHGQPHESPQHGNPMVSFPFLSVVVCTWLMKPKLHGRPMRH